MTNSPYNAWKNEPDEKTWTHAGLDCLILRQKTMGHLCGYVRIPETHILYGLNYMDIVPEKLKGQLKKIMNGQIGKRGLISVLCATTGKERIDLLFDVHGSITFSDKFTDRDGFWYGFDCTHSGDYTPYSTYHDEDDIYRDMNYVIAETNSLAKQIAALNEVKNDNDE